MATPAPRPGAAARAVFGSGYIAGLRVTSELTVTCVSSPAWSRTAVPVAPWRLSGVVYGALLNHAPALAALGEAVHAAPYKLPPKAPVLQLKPRNTLAGDGDAVVVPAGVEALEVGATLGIVIGRSACAVKAADALAHVAGYLVVNDVCVPLDSPQAHYRPAVRQRARDGFCPMGPRVVPAAGVPDPDALAVRIEVDGVVAQDTSTGGRIRSVARLIADVSDFMSLQPGDVLMLGPAAGAPRVRAGQTVSITIEGLGTLRNRFVSEAGAELA
jgi:5-oxopent-3-ene-1,2,5-tricarboxylate decarboxylase / 2-hydroxyhepta-2,4-diene-1,7-dioate isomerase